MNIKERERIKSKIKCLESQLEKSQLLFNQIKKKLQIHIRVICNDEKYPDDLDVYNSFRWLGNLQDVLQRRHKQIDMDMLYLIKDLRKAYDSYVLKRDGKELLDIELVLQYFMYHFCKHDNVNSFMRSNDTLHCLCFMAEGIHLASYCLPLTGDIFLSHKICPKSRSLITRWKNLDKEVTTAREAHKNINKNHPQVARILDFVIKVTSNLTPSEVLGITRNHYPWIAARDGVDEYEEWGKEIDPSIMAEYYQRFLDYHAENAPNPPKTLEERKEDLKDICTIMEKHRDRYYEHLNNRNYEKDREQ